jgi:hypothetical protein
MGFALASGRQGPAAGMLSGIRRETPTARLWRAFAMAAMEHDEETTHVTTIHRMAAAILAAALLAVPAAAEQVTLAAPIQAGSLHEGPLDMVLYYLPVVGGLLEVTGTYAPKGRGEARRFIMGLLDGDAVSFAMPGYPQATYRFGRAGATVTAAVAVSGTSRLAESRP